MTRSDVQRKLTAILCTDVVGYSRLMGDDHEGTLKTLEENRLVFSDKIKEYNGRVVNSPGDSILAEFGSVVDAVSCAVEVQNELAKRNHDLPENRKMEFRIGVNLGDVLVKDTELYGEGVNVAARLQTLADPGGICISGNVYDQVKNRLPLQIESLGTQKVKNIAEPVTAYKVLIKAGDVAPQAAWLRRVSTGKRRMVALAMGVLLAVAGIAGYFASRLHFQPALPLPDKPSIVVLPFANMSDDQEQEYFADGMTDDLITDISRVGDLFVIARNSAFTYKQKNVNVKQVARELGVRYVLEGSVRRQGNTVRINAQLIDATSDGHLWAERYDGTMDDIFALQDKLSKKIVSALTLHIKTKEFADRQEQPPTRNMAAYDAYLKGLAAYVKATPEGYQQAVSFLNDAVREEPGFANAHALLGMIYATPGMGIYLKGLPHDALWKLGNEHVEKAKQSPSVYSLVGAAMFARRARKYEEGLVEATKAITLDGNHPFALEEMGYALIANGRPVDAEEYFRKMMRVDPANRRIHVGIAKFYQGQYESAKKEFEQEIARHRENPFAHFYLAATLGNLGEVDEAEKTLAYFYEYSKMNDYIFNQTLSDVEASTYAPQELVWMLKNGLARAGMTRGETDPPGFEELVQEGGNGFAVEGVKTVTAQEAKALFNRGAVLIDVRGRNQHSSGLIPHAKIIVYPQDFTQDTLLSVASVDQEVVFFCSGPG